MKNSTIDLESLTVKARTLKEVAKYAKSFEDIFGFPIAEYRGDEEPAPATIEASPDITPVAADTADAPAKRATRKPNHGNAAKKYADFEPAESGCLCGCGDDAPEGTSFIVGHHRRLFAIVGAVEAGLLDFDKIAPHSYEYLVASGRINEELMQLIVTRQAADDSSDDNEAEEE